MSDALELDQEDFYGRLLAAPALEEVALLLQRKGVTENDITNALSVLNPRVANGPIGAIVIVLMPSIRAEDQSPGPRYLIELTAQVIEQPMFSQDATLGVGLSAEQIAQHVRTLGHLFSNGYGGTYTFAGMEPIPVAEGQISYGVRFTRQAGDTTQAKVALPTISATNSDTAPCTVTMACATAGATIWYTTDGSYPASTNAAALTYTAPFTQAAGATLRAAAERVGMDQSNVRRLVIAASTVPALGGEGGESVTGEGGETLTAEG